MESAAFDVLIKAADDAMGQHEGVPQHKCLPPRRRRVYAVEQNQDSFKIKIVTEDSRNGPWKKVNTQYLKGYVTVYAATCDVLLASKNGFRIIMEKE